MGVRRHPVVRAAIVSGFVVRAIDIAAALNRGFRGNLDRPLIRALARDLGQDLYRARAYARVRHLKLGVTVSRDAALVFAPAQFLARAPVQVPGQSPRRYPPAGYLDAGPLAAYFDAALDLTRELAESVGGILGLGLGLRLGSSRDEDLQMASELAEALVSGLVRVHPLNAYDNRARDLALDLALKRARSLERVCALNLAGRLCISSAEGLAEAVLEGALDDFTDADLAHASLAGADLTGVRWSLSGTVWPPGTDVKALLARSDQVQTATGALVFTRRGMMWQPAWRAT